MIAFGEFYYTQLSYIFTVYAFNLYFFCHAPWCKFRFPPTRSISASSRISTVHPSLSLLISAPFLLLSPPLSSSFSFPARHPFFISPSLILSRSGFVLFQGSIVLWLLFRLYSPHRASFHSIAHLLHMIHCTSPASLSGTHHGVTLTGWKRGCIGKLEMRW